MQSVGCIQVKDIVMNQKNLNPDEARLGTLLQESRTSPSLPPRFQENVWQRIEKSEAKSSASWLDALAGWLVRPRLAVAVAAMLVLIGVGLGWSNGEQRIRNEQQSRYLSAVAPNTLR